MSTTPLTSKSTFLSRMSPLQRRVLIATGLFVVILIASAVLQGIDPALPSLGIAGAIDAAFDWININFGGVIQGAKDATATWLLVRIERFFLWIPWMVWIPAVGIAAYKIVGARLAVIFVLSLLLVVSFELWDNAMSTLAVVATAMLLTLLIAIPLGIVASRNDSFASYIRPVLDAMQTTPAYVYLIPIVFLFNAGKASAVLAALIFAVPPAIRLTNLGLRQVSPEIREAARSFGATRWQMLFKVELPLALKTIMAGVNQSTMMAFAMVVIAAIIGAGGLGNDVLFAMSRQRVGDGFQAGFSILILAILLDRITQAFGERGKDEAKRE